MWMVVHLEYLLLLSCQVLRLSISVHHSKTHGAWHKNVVIIAIASVRRLHEVVLVRSSLIN